MDRVKQSRLLFAISLIVALFATPASASAHRMPQPAGLVTHHLQNADCSDNGDLVPCSDPVNGEIWVPRDSTRFEIAHETGHVWFFKVPTNVQRAWFIRKLRLPKTAQGGQLVDGGWYRGTGIHGDDSPDELAADAYAACDLGLSPRGHKRRDGSIVLNWPVGYDYNPSLRRHREICNAIAVLGLMNR